MTKLRLRDRLLRSFNHAYLYTCTSVACTIRCIGDAVVYAQTRHEIAQSVKNGKDHLDQGLALLVEEDRLHRNLVESTHELVRFVTNPKLDR